MCAAVRIQPYRHCGEDTRKSTGEVEKPRESSRDTCVTVAEVCVDLRESGSDCQDETDGRHSVPKLLWKVSHTNSKCHTSHNHSNHTHNVRLVCWFAIHPVHNNLFTVE